MIRKRDSFIIRVAVWPVIVLLLVGTAGAAPRAQSKKRGEHELKSNIISHAHFDGNNIDCIMTNDGRIVDCMVEGSLGMEWPRGTGKTIDFASGLWLAGIGQDDGLIYTACCEYSSELVPGPIGGYHQDEAYRIYKINSDSTGDWDVWPIDQGAPSQDGHPKLLGDQTIFWVCNDGNAAQHSNVFGTSPMSVEFQVTVFGFDQDNFLGDVMFIQWTIINKGTSQFDSCFVALWDDPDLGDPSDDLVGCDTTLSLGYCYNGHSTDMTYGDSPPAIGFDFLRGPEVPQGSGNYLPLTAFAWYWYGSQGPFEDPETPSEAFWFMNGYAGDGTPYTDAEGHVTSPFPLSGNPISSTGNIDGVLDEPGDRRFLMSSGPFVLAPGDTQIVVGAKIIAQGTDHINSIADLHGADVLIQNFYNETIVVVGGETSLMVPSRYRLSQNYPNPFNTETIIPFEISLAGPVSARIYNVNGQKVRDLPQGYFEAGSHQLRWDGRDNGGSQVACGLYFCHFRAVDFHKSIKMMLIR